jgi:hypothetical protein
MVGDRCNYAVIRIATTGLVAGGASPIEHADCTTFAAIAASASFRA